MFSPEWQQEALGVLLGKGRWVLQEINLEQCLPETSLKEADGFSNREFETNKGADISVLGCWGVAECPVPYQTGRLNDWNSSSIKM